MMRAFRARCALALAATLVALGPTAASATTRVTREPATLRMGERVLVDDGTCPAGQIKEVVDAMTPPTASGQPATATRRIRHCIRR
jgi:Family of unknown function (DUF6719)